MGRVKSLVSAIALIAASPALAQQQPSTVTNMSFASTPLSGSELLYVVQGGQPRKTTTGVLALYFGSNFVTPGGNNTFTGSNTHTGSETFTGAVTLSGVQSPNMAVPANNGGTAIRAVESGGIGSIQIGPGLAGLYGDYTNPNTYVKRYISGLSNTLPYAGVITNAVNNGAGLCRLTVSSTSHMTSGDTVSVAGVTGATGCNGNFTISNLTSTTVDLVGSTFGGTYTSKAAGSFTVGQMYRIVSVGTTNFTAIGASANTVGVWFVATGVGSGSGTASSAQIADVATLGTPVNAGQMAFGQYSPPDDGGDTSVLYALQSGGGNVLSLYNLCSQTPSGYTAYCNYGRGIELAVDGNKVGIRMFSQSYPIS